MDVVIKMFKRLKQLLIISILMVFTLGFTWQGKFDPNLIVGWNKKSEKISYVAYRIKKGILLIPVIRTVHIVPNDRTGVKTIKAFYIDYSLVSYEYYEDKKPHVFIFNIEKEEFIERTLTSEEATACINCHKSYREKGTETPPPAKPKPPENTGEILNADYQCGASHKRG